MFKKPIAIGSRFDNNFIKRILGAGSVFHYHNTSKQNKTRQSLLDVSATCKRFTSCNESESPHWRVCERGFMRHCKANTCVDSKDHQENGVA
uniref:Uncharacterized protein n=1 Tax=Glossina pallidipes TaxID=7398 RepID=A0A1A9Z4E2_GLOPL